VTGQSQTMQKSCFKSSTQNDEKDIFWRVAVCCVFKQHFHQFTFGLMFRIFSYHYALVFFQVLNEIFSAEKCLERSFGLSQAMNFWNLSISSNPSILNEIFSAEKSLNEHKINVVFIHYIIRLIIEYNIAIYYIIIHTVREIMGELSFLTIVVSLAVCSLLTYAIFQYMKVRFSILEQSHKEQALILQQYIEESSTDIHRLYQLNTTPSASRQMNHPPTGSIILEYANDREQNASGYNEPHTIHLDTAAFFQNSRGSGSKLIEISSDSEDTTDTDTDTSDSDSDSETETDSDSVSVSESDPAAKNNTEVVAVETDTIEVLQIDPTEITEVSTTEIKTVSVDLGTMQEPEIQSKEKHSLDVLSLLYKKSQETSTSVVEEPPSPAPVPSTSPSPSCAPIPLAAMSVNDLKALLKEKCKHQPEKHAEIQRLKKAELIYAIQQLQ
jgi:hypothetical protein